MADGACTATDRTFVDIAIDELHPSPTNPRKLPRDDEAKLRAAVAHILDTLEVENGEPVNGRGVRDPLRVRRRADGFEIIAGECRWCAARFAGLRRLTCEIVVLSDDEVLEEQLVENGARRDLSPLEEADGLAALRARGHSVEAIADRTGKPIRHVRQALALHDLLVPEAKALLAAGRISVRLALDVATLTPDAQRELVADLGRMAAGGEPLRRSDAEHAIQRRRLRLVDAGFSLDDPTLVPAAGACTRCPKNTEMQGQLWAEPTKQAECTDPKCHKAKRDAHAERLKADAKAKKIPFVAGAEAKKIFPSEWTAAPAYNAGVVDLDAPCEHIRPPKAEPKPHAEPRRGGPEKCPDPNYDGEHEWGIEHTAAARQPALPGLAGQSSPIRMTILAACKRARTPAQLVIGCRDYPKADVEVAIEQLVAEGALVRKGDKLVAAKGGAS